MRFCRTFWVLILLLVACGTDSADMVPAPVSTDFTTNENLPPNFDVEGHRGARGLKPENSLPAFETALDLGVTTLELDLHFTADQVVIIWHDDEIEKDKCGLEDVASTSSRGDARDPDSNVKWGEELMFSQLTLEQVKAYRCDRNPDSDRFPAQDSSSTDLAGDNYQIVTLEELFEFVQAYSQSEQKSDAQRKNAKQVHFNIETKRRPNRPKAINDGFDGKNPAAFELEILRIVTQFGLEERVIIQSFDHRSLWAIRSVNDSIRLAALTSGGVPNPLEYAELGANIWSSNYKDLSPALVNKAHSAGLLVIPWTVNDAEVMQELIEIGVDGIISDRPDVLLMLGEATSD